MFQKMLQGGGGGDGDFVLKHTDTSYKGSELSFTYTPTISKGLVEIVFINNDETHIDTITSTGSIEIISKTSRDRNKLFGASNAIIKINSAGTISFKGSGLFYPIINEYEYG